MSHHAIAHLRVPQDMSRKMKYVVEDGAVTLRVVEQRRGAEGIVNHQGNVHVRITLMITRVDVGGRANDS